ncbi:MAG: helix-turn-helix transcriptional regulator [Gammaproteobacteria bacterium]
MGTVASIHLRQRALSLAALPELVEALGLASFPKILVRALCDLVSAEHLSVIAFEPHRLPHVITAESAGRMPVAKMAGRIYEASAFRRHDPAAELVGREEATREHPLLLRVRPEDIEDGEYRAQIYRRFNLAEKLAIVSHSSGHWYALNLYRTQAAGEFTGADVEAARAAADLIMALIAKHFSLRPAVAAPASRPNAASFELLVNQLDCHLTSRQIQVCARALSGMTNRAIALDLGIGVPTVATLRKRAYASLNISSLNELFARCLAQSEGASRAS